MNFELIRIAIALIGTGAAAWQDAKTSFIDDKILFAMIAAGLVLDLLTFDLNFIYYSVGIAAAIVVVGYFAYRTGQLGGGDIFLFAGLQLLLPFFPQTILGLLPADLAARISFAASAQIIPFFVSVLVVSSFLATIGSAALYAWKLRNKKLQPELLPSAASVALIVVVLYFFNFVLHVGLVENVFLVLLLAAACFLTSFKAQIMRQVIITPVTIAKIEDEDVLATESMNPKLVARYKLGRVLTKKEVAKLKRIQKERGIRKFPVYKHLPRFGPYILAGLIVSLLLGDVISLLIL